MSVLTLQRATLLLSSYGPQGAAGPAGADGADGADGDDVIRTPITEATTTRLLTNADHARVILCTHASGCAVTVPGTLTPGFMCTLIQRGAASVTATGSGGLTVTPEPTFIPSTFGVGSAMSIYVESATVANAIGDLTEAP